MNDVLIDSEIEAIRRRSQSGDGNHDGYQVYADVAFLLGTIEMQRSAALNQAARLCEAIRDECRASWMAYAEKRGKKWDGFADEAYYASETANDCAKAIRQAAEEPGDE